MTRNDRERLLAEANQEMEDRAHRAGISRGIDKALRAEGYPLTQEELDEQRRQKK